MFYRKSDVNLFTKLRLNNLSWKEISQDVFHGYKPGTERQKETIALFATLWKRLATEFLDKNHIDEVKKDNKKL